jgi:hypothetical protein
VCLSDNGSSPVPIIQDALRVAVLSGDLPSKKLVSMTAVDLANEATKQSRGREQVRKGEACIPQHRTRSTAHCNSRTNLFIRFRSHTLFKYLYRSASVRSSGQSQAGRLATSVVQTDGQRPQVPELRQARQQSTRPNA